MLFCRLLALITDRQAGRLMRELTRGKPLVRAAMPGGMSETTAWRYREEPERGYRREARRYRTRHHRASDQASLEMDGEALDARGLEQVEKPFEGSQVVLEGEVHVEFSIPVVARERANSNGENPIEKFLPQ